jgi:hypothetical protein
VNDIAATAPPSLYVGIAGKRYRIERPWGAVPPGVKIGAYCDVATDSKSNVYVLQRFDPLVDDLSPPCVLVFDTDGKYLNGWGGEIIKDPHHFRIDAADRVYLVDRDAHQIRVFDTAGKLLFDIGERDRPGKPFNHPTSVAVAASGDIYVADGYGGTVVHRFAATGAHIRTWGEPGDGPGQFTTPHGIWVMPDGRVLVGDRENDRIQVFDPTGGFLYAMHGTHKPMSIYADARGIVFATDQVPRMVAYNAAGANLGGCRPVLNGAHGVSGDAQGNLYLSEMNPNRVTRMTPVSD